MNNIEILEKLIRQENFIDYEEYQVEIDTAIKNLLKERQADKDRIKELEYISRNVLKKQQGNNKINQEWQRFMTLNQQLKFLVKEKIKELDKQEKKELKGMKGQDRYAVKLEYQHKRSVLQELLGEKQDLQISKEE